MSEKRKTIVRPVDPACREALALYVDCLARQTPLAPRLIPCSGNAADTGAPPALCIEWDGAAETGDEDYEDGDEGMKVPARASRGTTERCAATAEALARNREAARELMERLGRRAAARDAAG